MLTHSSVRSINPPTCICHRALAYHNKVSGVGTPNLFTLGNLSKSTKQNVTRLENPHPMLMVRDFGGQERFEHVAEAPGARLERLLVDLLA